MRRVKFAFVLIPVGLVGSVIQLSWIGEGTLSFLQVIASGSQDQIWFLFDLLPLYPSIFFILFQGEKWAYGI